MNKPEPAIGQTWAHIATADEGNTATIIAVNDGDLDQPHVHIRWAVPGTNHPESELLPIERLMSDEFVLVEDAPTD